MEDRTFFTLLDELFEVEAGTVTAASVLEQIPGWSSLTFVGLIALIAEECGIAVRPDVIRGSRTVGDLWRKIEAQKSRAAA